MIEYTNKYCNVLNKDGYMGNNTAHVFIYNIFSKYCNGSFLREDNKIITTKYFRQSLFTYFSAFILYAFKIGGNKIWLRQHIFRPFVAVFFCGCRQSRQIFKNKNWTSFATGKIIIDMIFALNCTSTFTLHDVWNIVDYFVKCVMEMIH